MQNGRNVNSIKTEVRLLATVNLSISSRVAAKMWEASFYDNKMNAICILSLGSAVRSVFQMIIMMSKYEQSIVIIYNLFFMIFIFALSAVSSERFANAYDSGLK